MKPEGHKSAKIGVWIIGAYGSVASCAILGGAALAKGLCPHTGLVTETPLFEDVPLVKWSDIVFGGIDIRSHSVLATLSELRKQANVIPYEYIDNLKECVESVEKDISLGFAINCGDIVNKIASTQTRNDITLEEAVSFIQAELNKFKRDNSLERVVVVNLASTEPYINIEEEFSSKNAIIKAIADNRRDLYPVSLIYAWSAISEGCSYINFTPSLGASLIGVKNYAVEKRVPICGNDGKTGETLVKSVLAPMFVYRNLRVMSWEGYNILGNYDGLVLDDPKNKESKIRSKSQSLSKILGYNPHSSIHINMVPSLNDWKVAWDFIHFKGFMDTPMIMQVLWQGCDSILAAPLVLDLVRLVDLSAREGDYGAQSQYSCFFKDPMDCDVYDLRSQFDNMVSYIFAKKRKRD